MRGLPHIVVSALLLAGCRYIFPYSSPDGALGDARAPDSASDASRDHLALLDLSGELPPTLDLATSDLGNDDRTRDVLAPDLLAPPQDRWLPIQAGQFVMGSPTSELCRDADEIQHSVTLTHGFEMQATEVTVGQYQQRVGAHVSSTSCGQDDCPASGTSWHEAAAYCNALSAAAGKSLCYVEQGSKKTCKPVGPDAPNPCASGESCVVNRCVKYAPVAASIYGCPGYRLPTEAEWEYAYRAGTKTAYYWGPASTCNTPDSVLDQYAWSHSLGGIPHPVAKKQPNAWGLYDMAGNLEEWTNDYKNQYATAPVTDPIGPSSGTWRVMRGGSAGDQPECLRAAYRYAGHYVEKPTWDVGFRCVRTLP